MIIINSIIETIKINRIRITDHAEPIHSVWAYYAEVNASVLITTYRPDPKKWMEDWKTRRK